MLVLGALLCSWGKLQPSKDKKAFWSHSHGAVCLFPLNPRNSFGSGDDWLTSIDCVVSYGDLVTSGIPLKQSLDSVSIMITI